MFDRLRAMLVKEFIQVLRDRRMRLIVFVFPAIQTVIFGYAVNTDVRQVATAIVDRDRSPASRELVASFEGSGYFRIREYVRDEERVRQLLDRGEVRLVLRMDPGFGDILAAGRSAPLQVLVDGTESNTAGIILGYVRSVVARAGAAEQERRMARQGLTTPVGQVVATTRIWFNENLESRNYYVPALIANIVLVITILLSSMAVVREKEIGTIEQIIVTPISRTEFILGKTLPFVLVGFADVAIITAVARFWFQVPMRGSLWLLFAATGLFLLSTLGFGLFISTVSSTQQQAMMSAFFFIFPCMLLSGFAFPIENMPESVKWLTFLNPLRYYLVAIRSIFLKGVGFAILWPQLLGLFLLGTGILAFAVSRFRKSLP